MNRLKVLLGGACALALAACGEAAKEEPKPTEMGPDTASAASVDVSANTFWGDDDVPGFYADAPPAGFDAKPGALIRKEELAAAFTLAEAGRAERFVYVSTDGLDGKTLRLASGAVFLPKSERPADGWPVIAWAHGTVGIADVCAPSKNPRSERDTKYLNHWLAQGYAVVASNYTGLGTPGGHPYLATRAAAYSILDSIRAAQAQDYGLSGKVVLVGQSQGGGAAFATAGEAAGYAPEIDIRGTVATGTPYFTNDTAPATRDPNAVSGVLAYSMYIMYLAEQADPLFKIADYASLPARPFFESTRSECLMSTWNKIEAEGMSQAKLFTADPTAALAKFYPLMAYTSLKLKGPVFMGTGGKDADVPPPGQGRLFKDACAAGTVIEHKVYPALDHSGTVNGSLADSTPFVKKAFAGEAIPGNCPAG